MTHKQWHEWLRTTQASLASHPETVPGPHDGETVRCGYANDSTKGDSTYAVLNGTYEDAEYHAQRPLEVEIVEGVTVPLNEVRIYLPREAN